MDPHVLVRLKNYFTLVSFILRCNRVALPILSIFCCISLKVLDQTNLENKFCLNFGKVSFHLSSSSKVKKLHMYILFWSSRKKLRLSYLLFYWVWLPHLAIYLTRFWLFLRKYPILERQISGCEWEKYEPSIGTKNLKNFEVSWGSKKWSGHGPLM